MNVEILNRLLNSGNEQDLFLAQAYLDNPYLQFEPRPNNPEEGDEQDAWINDNWDGIQCLIAGNAAGKTYCSAWKFARELETYMAPQPNTPVWILSQTLEMSGTIWSQALSLFLNKDKIDHIRWRKQGLYPETVVLKADENGNNFIIQFFSYEMGRQALQAANVFMAWMDEQAPQVIIEEVVTRLRTWWHPNCCFYSLTPLTPDPYLQDLYERRFEPEVSNLWKFYRLNTIKNDFINAKWKENFLNSLSPEQRQTRQFGDFASYSGAIYPEFKNHHVISPIDLGEAKSFLLGVDFGYRFSAAVWVAMLGDKYYIFDELIMMDTLTEDFVEAIKAKYIDYRYKCYSDYADPAAMRRMNIGGIHNTPARKDVTDGIECLRSLFFSDKIFIFKTCKKLVQQLKNYVWKDIVDKQGRDIEVKDEPKKINDHLPDALRYAIYTNLKSDQKPWVQPDVPRTPKLLDGKSGMPKIFQPQRRPQGLFGR